MDKLYLEILKNLPNAGLLESFYELELTDSERKLINQRVVNFYEKIQVPPPTWCPECRMQRRFAWRNERTLHRNTCAATGKPVLSMYAPELPLTVYEENYWKSDAWDPMDYGMEYDSARGFFEQFNTLFFAVPHPNLIQKNCVGSEYSNHTLNIKNCYFFHIRPPGQLSCGESGLPFNEDSYRRIA